MLPQEVAEQLLAEKPLFHSGGTSDWGLSADTLRLLARSVRPGNVTLEVGCGASTLVLAAAASRHVAISPAAQERHLILAWADQQGMDLSTVEFLDGRSDEILPTLSGSFDLALIDGAHNFPVPIVDFHYVRRLLPMGATLVLDDVNIPSIGVVYRFLTGEARWRLTEVVDGRAAAFRRVANDPEFDDWGSQRFNASYPDYSQLPLGDHLRYSLKARLSRSALLGSVRKRFPALGRTRLGH